MTTLLVPIALDVLVIREADAPRDWAATAMAEPEVGPGQPSRQQLRPSPFTDLPTARPPGAYLQWALPDALTQGTPRNGTIELPALPDRWLVVRLTTPSAPGPRQVDAWLIPDAGADKALSLSGVLDGTPLPPAGTPHQPMTAWGRGDVAWSAYFDNVAHRFALHDDLTGVEGAVAYLVCGWYIDTTLDPIKATSESEFRERMLALQWSLNGSLPSGMPFPERSVYHAAAVSIGWPKASWPGDGGLLARELDQWPDASGIVASLGETLAESIATLASQGNATPGYAKLLEAKLSGVLGDITGADGIAALESALHVARFGSAPSASTQDVSWQAAQGEDADTSGAFRTNRRSTPRTWQATDPSILVQGAGRNPKHGGDGRYSARGELVCRIDGQTLTAFGVTGGDSGEGTKRLPDEPLKGLHGSLGVPPVATALVVELCCLDPAGAPDLELATPDASSPVAAARARWWACFDPAVPEADALKGSSRKGVLPSPVCVTPPTRPWTPIHLEWTADYLPSPRGTRDWVLGEADFELPDQIDRPGADSDHRLGGRTLLSAGPAALLAQASGDTEMADADLLGGALEEIAVQLRGDSRLAVVGSDAQDTPDPTPPGFLPLRAGFLRLDRVRIVDGYGQFVELLGPAAAPEVPVLMGPGLAAPGEPDLAALRPRFTAPARVMLRFVDVDDPSQDLESGASPVCGYIVPSLSDGTLEFFDALGAGWGRLRPDERRGIAWEESPGRERTLGSRPSAVLANRLLGRFADSLIDLDVAGAERPTSSLSALATLLKVMDTTRWATDLTGHTGDEYLSLLLGQPIAVVRAAIDIEIQDPRQPAENNSTAISVRLGTLSHLQDGLLGYFVGDDLRTLRLVDPAIAELSAVGGEAPLHPTYADASGVFHANPGSTVPLCLLMAPGSTVHVTTGLLPRKNVGLQRDWTAAALSRLAPSLRFGPVLRDAQATRLPVASGLRGDWRWHRRPDPSSWATDVVVPSTAAGAAPDGAMRAYDGWLQFKLAPDTPHNDHRRIQVEVISVRRRGQGSHAIDAVEVRNEDGTTALLPVSMVIGHLESGRFAFFVSSPGQARAYLRVVRRRGARPYVRTIADTSDPNNLGQQRTFEGRKVPNLIGLSVGEARDAITDADLVPEVERRFNARPVDEIVTQRPGAGVEISRGSTVRLVASDGPAATVPDVIGLDVDRAIGLVKAEGLGVSVGLRFMDTRLKGEVDDQSPTGGTLVRRDSSVGLTVSKGPAAVVPDLVGRQHSEAAALLNAARLVAGSVVYSIDPHPEGEIAAQSPAAGARVEPGSAVSLTVSNGPLVTVPALIGQTLLQARLILQHASLSEGAIQDTFSSATAGTVISQRPAPGTRLQPGSSIDLDVSDGKGIVVPDVTRTSLTNARGAIMNAGLNVGGERRRFDAAALDNVIGQSPAAGAVVRPSTNVDLDVSDGPGVAVPNLLGSSQTNASAAIVAAGLEVGTVRRGFSPDAKDTVIDQRPGPGTTVQRGSNVDLGISDGPSATVPNVVGQSLSAATTALTDTSLSRGTVGYRVAPKPKGEVVAQVPGGGSVVARGSPVNLIISDGDGVTVPNVVGMSQAAAGQVLSAVQLTGFTAMSVQDSGAAGTVLGQRPAAGTKVLTGTAVGLTVSTGPGGGPTTPTTVPV